MNQLLLLCSMPHLLHKDVRHSAVQDAREAGHLLTARHLLDQQVRPIPASGTNPVAEVTGKPGQTL